MLLNMLGYVFFLGLVRIMQITPFWLLHRFSDGLYLLMCYGVKYRYKVVYQNIKGSFPNKSEAEIQKIVNGFYQHLCDMALESLKGFTCSKELLINIMGKGAIALPWQRIVAITNG
jgi:Kdo2-lipid IVA lauroyltransferase/acyltransferase